MKITEIRGKIIMEVVGQGAVENNAGWRLNCVLCLMSQQVHRGNSGSSSIGSSDSSLLSSTASSPWSGLSRLASSQDYVP